MRSIIDGLANRNYVLVSAGALAETPLRALNAGVNGGCDCDGDCGQGDCDCSSDCDDD